MLIQISTQNILMRAARMMCSPCVLLLAIVLTMTSVSVSAQTSTWDGTNPSTADKAFATVGISGSGTSADPYVITTAQQFAYFGWICANKKTGYASGVYWKLDTDIDLNNIEWDFGNGNKYGNTFYGVFDGGGHTIKNVKITMPASGKNYGLFRDVTGATTATAVVKNLTVDGVTMKSSVSLGSGNIGGVIGKLGNYSKVETVNVKNVTITQGNNITGGTYIGALIGNAASGTEVKNCNSEDATISVTGSATYARVSGLVGYSSAALLYPNTIDKNTVTNASITFGSTTNNVYAGAVLAQAGNFVHVTNNTSTGFNLSVADATVSTMLSALVGYEDGSQEYNNIVEGNTVSNATVTLSGEMKNGTTGVGLLVGLVKSYISVINNKVTGATINLGGKHSATTYIGGMIGLMEAYSHVEVGQVEGITIKATASNYFTLNQAFCVGGMIGALNTAGAATNQANYFINCFAKNVDIDLSNYTPTTSSGEKYKLTKSQFSIGGVCGRLNQPYKVPEMVYFDGKINAPFAAVGPIVGTFYKDVNNAAYVYNDYSGENTANVTSEEVNKATATWYYGDYKLGVSSAVQNASKTKNFETSDVTDGYITITDWADKTANSISGTEKASKTVLPYTAANNTDADLTIYPLFNNDKTIYPAYYMYYMQGVNRGTHNALATPENLLTTINSASANAGTGNVWTYSDGVFSKQVFTTEYTLDEEWRVTTKVLADGQTPASSYHYVWTLDGVEQTSHDSSCTVESDKNNSKTLIVTIYSDANMTYKVAQLETTVPRRNWINYSTVGHSLSGDGTETSPYLINNKKDLAYFMQSVRNGNTYLGQYVELTADVDLSEAWWTPIGNMIDGNTNVFGGTFSGAGHVVSNVRLCWYQDPVKVNESLYAKQHLDIGFFAQIKGTGTSKMATVQNLILDNVTIDAEEISKLGYNRNIGTLVGRANQYSTIRNIIVRKSMISDGGLSFDVNGKTVRIGGVVGSIQDNKVDFNIYNLTSDCEISLGNLIGTITNLYVGGIFGYINSTYSASYVFPCNIYYQGTMTVPTGATRVGTIYGTASNDVTAAEKTNWYYLNANSSATYIMGVQTTDCEKIYTLNNSLIDSRREAKELYTWDYSTKFYFIKRCELNGVLNGSNIDVTCLEEPVTNRKYVWYIDDEKVAETTENTYSFSKDKVGSIVYCKGYDGGTYTFISEDLVLQVDINVTGKRILKVEGENKTTTYSIDITGDAYSEANCDVTYAWKEYYGDTTYGTGTEPTWTKKEQTSSVVCHVTITGKSDGTVIYDADVILPSNVVFICPTGEGTTYSKGSDANNGLTPETAVETWGQAYSLLGEYENTTWDDNVIVLVGESDADHTWGLGTNYSGAAQRTNSSTKTSNGFYGLGNVMSNNLTTGLGTLDTQTPSKTDYDNYINNSPMKKNVTITGQYDGVDYGGVLKTPRSSSSGRYINIYGDTKFENLTFYGYGLNYDIIFCHFNNLYMGEGLIMKHFWQGNSYHTISGATMPGFQIFGGMNNDRRFISSNHVTDEAYESSMPHREKGFKITVKSGYYSIICVGSRQDRDSDPQGSPTYPIKCTIDVDINHAWNESDGHNVCCMNNSTESQYDIALIMAGNHEGVMYADTEIKVQSGRVARVVNGSLGAIRNIPFTYDKTKYQYPNNTFFGRAKILLDPREPNAEEKSLYSYGMTNECGVSYKSKNDMVVVTELYGGGVGRAHSSDGEINLPSYSVNSLIINGATISGPTATLNSSDVLSGIFGGGAGGSNGVGNDENHTKDQYLPYWSSDKKVVLYGDYSKYKANNKTNKKVGIKCYNEDTDDYTWVYPDSCSTTVTINDGVFGDSNRRMNIYGGGSGYTSTFFFNNVSSSSYANTQAGNIYGPSVDFDVVNLTINGGTFYGDIYGAGRGTAEYYSTKVAVNKGANFSYANYTALGQTYGAVRTTINGGTIHGNVFGAGAGVGDAVMAGTTTTATLSEMAKLYGKATLNITGGTIYGNVYGGGDMANVQTSKTGEYSNGADKYDNDATEVNISEGATIYGMVFAGANGRQGINTEVAKAEQDEKTNSTNDDRTISPSEIGQVSGNTNLTVTGGTIWNRVFGGSRCGDVHGNTNVVISGGNFGRSIYGGSWGPADTIYTDNTKTVVASVICGGTYGTNADIYGNTNVTITGGKFIWDKYVPMYFGAASREAGHDDWMPMEDNIVDWGVEGTVNAYGDRVFTAASLPDDERFYDSENSSFVLDHNIYGGGCLSCNVGGKSTVKVYHAMLTDDITQTDKWLKMIEAGTKPQFYVFGAGYGEHTTVSETDVDVDISKSEEKDGEGDVTLAQQSWDGYKNSIKADWDVLEETDKKAAANGTDDAAYGRYESYRFAIGKGLARHTVVGVVGGGLNGYVKQTITVTEGEDEKKWSGTGNTKVHVGEQTWLQRVFGGGLGSTPASYIINGSEDYGQVDGSTDVTIDGSVISRSVFGGGAGINDVTTTDGTIHQFEDMARVFGSTKVQVKNDATRVINNIYGGGDIANVGTRPTSKDYGVVSKAMAKSPDVTIQNANGDSTTYKNITSYVNIQAGQIFGEVFAAGNGRASTDIYTVYTHKELNADGETVDVYTRPEKSNSIDELLSKKTKYEERVGNVIGNTLIVLGECVPVSDTYPKGWRGPSLYDRVYGGGQCGDVISWEHAASFKEAGEDEKDNYKYDAENHHGGNTNVAIHGGSFGHNIFGGGLGYVERTYTVDGVEQSDGAYSGEPLDEVPSDSVLASANVDGNTNMYIDGGRVEWEQMWTSGTNRGWNQSYSAKYVIDANVDGNDETESYEFTPQFYPIYSKTSENVVKSGVFLINHNIYGGGRYACEVGGSSNVKVLYGMIDETLANTVSTDVTSVNAISKACRPEYDAVYQNAESPHFFVFGAGYGTKTSVAGNVNMLIDCTLSKERGAYVWRDVDNIWLVRYGVQNKTYLGAVGGGYMGTVAGSTYIDLSGSSSVRRVYGGGFKASVGTKDSICSTNVNVTGGIYSAIFGGGYQGEVIGDTYVTVDHELHAEGTTDNDAEVARYIDGTPVAHKPDGTNLGDDIETFISDNLFGGGYQAKVDGNTNVVVKAGYLGNSIYAGGCGDIEDNIDAAVGGNTNLTVLRKTTNADRGGFYFVSEQTLSGNDRMYGVYGGGRDVCTVSGKATVTMYRSLFGDKFCQQVMNNANGINDTELAGVNPWDRHFSVCGGGYGELTSVGSTEVIADLTAYNYNSFTKTYTCSGGKLAQLEGGAATYYNNFRNRNYNGMVPEQAFVDIVGGGSAGSVRGKTKVVTKGAVFGRNIYGGSLAADVQTDLDKLVCETQNNEQAFFIKNGAGTDDDPFVYSSPLTLTSSGNTFADYLTEVNVEGGLWRKVFGGAMMGACYGQTFLNIGTDVATVANNKKEATGAMNDSIYIREVYGGNDVSGRNGFHMVDGDAAKRRYEPEGAHVNVYGGLIDDLYGGGNGDYAYYQTFELDKDKDKWKSYDLRRSVGGLSRPNLYRTYVNIKGGSDKHPVTITGSVYGGGNSCSIGHYLNSEEQKSHDEVYLTNVSTETLHVKYLVNQYFTNDLFSPYPTIADATSNGTEGMKSYPSIGGYYPIYNARAGYGEMKMNIGSHVRIDKLYMGNNGENLYDNETDDTIISSKKFYTTDGETWHAGICDQKDWDSYAMLTNMGCVPSLSFNDDGSFVPNELNLNGIESEHDNSDKKGKWNDGTYKSRTTDAVDVEIGEFYGGGNRGSMVAGLYTAGANGTEADQSNKDMFIYTLPAGVTVTKRVVAGSNNAYLWYKKDASTTFTTTNGFVPTFDTDNIASDGAGYNLMRGEIEYWYTPWLMLNLNCNFSPVVPVDSDGNTIMKENGTEVDYSRSDEAASFKGVEVYGGCYNSGIIYGSVTVNLNSDLTGLSNVKDFKTPTNYNGTLNDGTFQSARNENFIKTYQAMIELHNNTAGQLYGGGYGSATYTYGDINVNVSGDNTNVASVFGGGLAGGVFGNICISFNGGKNSTVLDGLYGGGNEGDVYGASLNDYSAAKGDTTKFMKDVIPFASGYNGITFPHKASTTYNNGYGNYIESNRVTAQSTMYRIAATAWASNIKALKSGLGDEKMSDNDERLVPYKDVSLTGNTDLHIRSGHVRNFFGGSRVADVYGGTRVYIGDAQWNADGVVSANGEYTPHHVISNTCYGGNDIGGQVKGLNYFIVNTDRGKELRTSSTYIKMTNTKSTDDAGEGENLPFVAELFGGGNGDYTYGDAISRTATSNAAVTTKSVTYCSPVHVTAENKEGSVTKDVTLPDVARTFIEYQGGTVWSMYAGGNNVTATDSAVLVINDSQKSDGKLVHQTGTSVYFSQNNAKCYSIAELVNNRVVLGSVFNVDANASTPLLRCERPIVRLFGGNNKADMAIQPEWHFMSGYAGNVYSGGNMGRMTYYNAENDKGLTGTPGLSLTIDSDDAYIDNIFGGCRMANVEALMSDEEAKEANAYVFGKTNIERGKTYYMRNGTEYRAMFHDTQLGTSVENGGTTPPNQYGATLSVKRGTYGNVYGGNDISGVVYNGAHVIVGGTVYGDVYGAGNGNYYYQYDKTGSYDAVTEESIDGMKVYKYIVPQSYSKGITETDEDAIAIEAINKARPNVDKNLIELEGSSTADPSFVAGSVYCGGNSATVTSVAIDKHISRLSIGSYVTVNNVFLGSNGEHLAEAGMADTIKILNGIGTFNKQVGDEYLLDKYMAAVDVYSLPMGNGVEDKTFNLKRTGYRYHDCNIGSFYVGGNRGSLFPSGDIVDLEFPQNITIFNKVVGASNNANFTYDGYTHRGGLCFVDDNNAKRKTPKTRGDVKLHVRSDFRNYRMDMEKGSAEDYYLINNVDASGMYQEGSNVYGGCYTSGDVYANVKIELFSDLIEVDRTADGFTEQLQRALVYRRDNDDEVGIRTGEIYGAGWGADTNVYGNCEVDLLAQATAVYGDEVTGGDNPTVEDEWAYAKGSTPIDNNTTGESTDANIDVIKTPAATGVFGGSNQGEVYGNTTVKVRAGEIAKNIFGGCVKGKVHGSSQIIVGYPTYYTCNTTGEYNMLRADNDDDSQTRKFYSEAGNEKSARHLTETKVKYYEGDIVPANVYRLICDYDAAYTGSAQADKFTKVLASEDQKEASSRGSDTRDLDKETELWQEINIHNSVYGGGMATNNNGEFGVQKFTEADCATGYVRSDAVGYGGNTCIIVADAWEAKNDGTYYVVDGWTEGEGYDGAKTYSVTKDYISISETGYTEVEKKSGADLYNTYTKNSKGEYVLREKGELAVADGNDGYTETVKDEAGNEKTIKHIKGPYYELTGSGGLYGEGQNLLVEGFRAADIYGYGYNEATPAAPHSINTFQRFDIVSANDCCMQLFGDLDDVDLDKTTYAICRVNELELNSSIDDQKHALIGYSVISDEERTQNNAKLHDKTHSRNFVCFYRDVHYLGAITSNASFENNKAHNPEGGFYAVGKETIEDVGDVSVAVTTDAASDANLTYEGLKALKAQTYYLHDENELDENDGGVDKNEYYKYDYYSLYKKYHELYETSKSEGDEEKAKAYEEKTKAYKRVFDQRNYCSAKNMIGINNGFALYINNIYNEASESSGDKLADKYQYGPVTGVFEVKILSVFQGEGGGFIYARNMHDESEVAKPTDISSAVEKASLGFVQRKGNFVFSGTQYSTNNTDYQNIDNEQYIIDDCYKLPYDAREKTPNAKTAHAQPYSDGHYWYVEGHEYVYNANITGLTGDHTGSTKDIKTTKIDTYTRKGEEFDLSNLSQQIVLLGTLQETCTRVALSSVKWLSENNDKEIENWSQAASDLYFSDLQTPGDAKAPDTSNSAPDYKLLFAINDNDNGNGNNKYYEYESVTGVLPRGKNGEAFDEKTTGLFDPPSTDDYQEDHDALIGKWLDKTYTSTDPAPFTEDEPVMSISLFDWTNNKEPEYYDKHLSKSELVEIVVKAWQDGDEIPYTYTVYLTIDYVLGPDISGNIQVENCALPGEYICINKDNVTIKKDESLGTQKEIWELYPKVGEYTDADGNVVPVYSVTSKDITKYYKSVALSDGTSKPVVMLPAVYWQSGAKIKYGIKVGNVTNAVMLEQTDATQYADTILVHNYHKMDAVSSHNLQPAVSVRTEKPVNSTSDEETKTVWTSAPRIYIEDQSDLTAFNAYLKNNQTDIKPEEFSKSVDGKTYILSVDTVPQYLAGEKFYLSNNITMPDGYSWDGTETFAGELNGDGYSVIANAAEDESSATASTSTITLLPTNNGKVYNLGCVGAEIAKATETGEIGEVYNSYSSKDETKSEWAKRYGALAYNLNGYYIDKREAMLKTKETQQYSYVEDYYSNGDYLYARARSTSAVTGTDEYIRTGTPNYSDTYPLTTSHDTSHPVDFARVVGYEAKKTNETQRDATDEEMDAGLDTNGKIITYTETPAKYSRYAPLYEANVYDENNADVKAAISAVSTGMPTKNDYLFFGQTLNSASEGNANVVGSSLPTNIDSHNVTEMTNRVRRAAGYYGSKTQKGYYYNPGAYVFANGITAIDFHGYNVENAVYLDPGITSINIPTSTGVTRNLLVYTNESGSDDYTVINGYEDGDYKVAYGEETAEANIIAHHIVPGTGEDGKPTTALLHLVERDVNNLNGEGAAYNSAGIANNDFNAPIAFDVTQRAWYTRQPLAYSSGNNAWEGICLPFTANRVVASVNGEITHFYGSDNAAGQVGDGENQTKWQTSGITGHDYWLRGFTAINGEKATFARPGTESETFNVGKDAASGAYNFYNDYYSKMYGSSNYNAGPREAVYDNYQFLTANVPYIVSFPGEKYYEYDLSGQFYHNKLNQEVQAQSITYNYYVDNTRTDGSKTTEISSDISPDVKGTLTIPVTDDNAVVTRNNDYEHHGTFAAIAFKDATEESDVSGIYAVNVSTADSENTSSTTTTGPGTCFVKNSDIGAPAVVTPFRTYMTAASIPVVISAFAKGYILIYESADVHETLDPQEQDEEVVDVSTGESLRVYPSGRKLIVESTFATTLQIYSASGQLVRIIDVRPGTSAYSGFASGIYIVGKKKVRIG